MHGRQGVGDFGTELAGVCVPHVSSCILLQTPEAAKSFMARGRELAAEKDANVREAILQPAEVRAGVLS